MRFKDYLIIPAVAMYIIYTSCAYIGEPIREEKTQRNAPSVIEAYECSFGSKKIETDKEYILEQIITGEFINTNNPNDRFIFKDNGKSCEYLDDNVYKGKWTLGSGGTISVSDNASRQNFSFGIELDRFGEIKGFTFNNNFYMRTD